MSVVKVCVSNDFEVDYDTDRGMYRVSTFEDGHFKNEYWFDAYEEKEIGIKDISQPIKKFEKFTRVRDDVWWCGYCPRCGQMLDYNNVDENKNNKKQYCWKCGQLVEFK